MKIYNTLSRRKEAFQPIKRGRVGMYVCGPTVYDEPHIGHARAAYIFEMVRSYFEYKGYKVKFVKNITDVDDKIIARAKEEFPKEKINQAVKRIAATYTRRYYEDMDVLGIRRADFAPRATEAIKEMIKYIEVLIKEKYAYQVDGNVYFNVRRFRAYGRLSHQDLDQIYNSVRIEKDEHKKDVFDFALWKKAKGNEPFWESPWGKGRPGWHIECSVMSSKYLGEEFDIHAGGVDLVFPHHENEIAQSRCYSGKGFARIWMHNGLLTINQQKMAKSLGNFISVKSFLQENNPAVLKLFFLSSHYRSPIDFNEEKIDEAKKAYERFQIFQQALKRRISKSKRLLKIKRPNRQIAEFKQRFEKAMDEDFNTPEALAVLFDLRSFGHKMLSDDKNKNQQLLKSVFSFFRDCCNIFGISFAETGKEKISKAEIETLIKTRQDLRKRADFAGADKIRTRLQENGVVIEDTKKGTIWRRKA